MVRLRIKEMAEAKGYNMSSLSRATDISFKTIRRLWKHPESGANIVTLNKIALVLNVTVDELYINVSEE
jgi:DNA-binding Xre family transcriptional regulator